MKRKYYKVQSRLMLVQFFLVVPVTALLLFTLVYWIGKDTRERIDSACSYLLRTTASSFDDLYRTSKKLLETPYTDKAIYSAITRTYTDAEYTQKTLDARAVSSSLTSMLYYAPEVSSVVLVSNLNGSIHYKRVPPTTAPNYTFGAWTAPFESDWYTRAMASEGPVITAGIPIDLYRNSGATVSFSQRLRNVMLGEDIGAIRIDLSIENVAKTWQPIVSSPQDVFFVLDNTGQLLYASNSSFLQTHPLLTVLDPAGSYPDYIVNSVRAPQSGFQFVYLTEKHTLARQSRMLYLLVGLIALIYLGASTLYIFWSSRHISHPIQQLKAAMLKGQQKDLTVRCEPLGGEMGVLSESFNSMMDTITKLVLDVQTTEREKSKLAYEVLQSKVSPHFLYNTLNAIRWKADLLGAKEVSHALESLSSLLQFSIKCTSELIPFETELTQLENYICIMRVRYGDDIEINYDIDEACYQYQCLKFLIQPAVENCYLHAFNNDKDTLKLITVHIECKEQTICISIEDSGAGMTQQQIALLLDDRRNKGKKLFAGIGISNVRQRLKAAFGSACELRVESKPGAYTRIFVEIPKILREERTDDTFTGG